MVSPKWMLSLGCSVEKDISMNCKMVVLPCVFFWNKAVTNIKQWIEYWLSGEVSLYFRTVWELLIDTLIQVSEFVDVVWVVGCSHPFWSTICLLFQIDGFAGTIHSCNLYIFLHLYLTDCKHIAIKNMLAWNSAPIITIAKCTNYKNTVITFHNACLRC